MRTNKFTDVADLILLLEMYDICLIYVRENYINIKDYIIQMIDITSNIKVQFYGTHITL